jgi:hypothetical protein
MITAMLTKVVAAFMVVTTTGLVMTVKKFAEAVPVSSQEGRNCWPWTKPLRCCFAWSARSGPS